MASLVSEQHEVTLKSGRACVLGPLSDPASGALFGIFADVVATGEGYPHRPPLTREDFNATWVQPVTIVVGANLDGQLAGAYYLKPNFPGRAAHIANAGYVVGAPFRSQGIGRALVEDSIWRAPLLGFGSIMFNLVFDSNPARQLYEELGWREIGRLPEAVEGEDALIYWRRVSALRP
jgi:GNAT superfamily N-acetyltransferase